MMTPLQNAMMIGWVGGCPAHAVSLHALTTAQDSDNGDEPGKSNVAFSNWKYRHYFSLMEIKGKNVFASFTLWL